MRPSAVVAGIDRARAMTVDKFDRCIAERKHARSTGDKEAWIRRAEVHHETIRALDVAREVFLVRDRIESIASRVMDRVCAWVSPQ